MCICRVVEEDITCIDDGFACLLRWMSSISKVEVQQLIEDGSWPVKHSVFLADGTEV